MDILTVSNMYPSRKDPAYGTFVRNFYESIRSRNPEGKVIEIIGHINDPGVDIIWLLSGGAEKIKRLNFARISVFMCV